MRKITITRPDDWHLHLRDGDAMKAVLPDTARRFARAIVMPNLKPPVTTVAQAAAYRERIQSAVTPGPTFEPLMTLYLTDNLPASEIDAAKQSGFVHAVKLYPAGATTNSDAGVTDLKKCAATLARMEKLGMPLLVHGEVTDPAVDIFDREAVFIDTVLAPLLKDFPALKVVLEHITTRDGAEFVKAAGANVARDDHRASPAAQPQRHLRWRHPSASLLFASVEARVAPPGAGRGGDFQQSEILPRHRFGAACEERQGNGLRLRRLLHRACGHRAVCRGLRGRRRARPARRFRQPFRRRFLRPASNTETITLVREPWAVPLQQPLLDSDPLVPLRAGESIAWRLETTQ